MSHFTQPATRITKLSASVLAILVMSTMAFAQTTPVKKKAQKAQKVQVTDETNSNAAANAAATPEAAAPADSGDKLLLKFNTDEPSTNTDIRAPLKFTAPGQSAAKSNEEVNPLSEDAPFKTYIGYPKSTIGVSVEPMALGMKWTFQGQDFNFTDSPIGYGLDYKFEASPLLSFDVSYLHWSDSVAASTVLPYNIHASTYSYDTFFVGSNFCFVSQLTFLKRLCPGVVLGRDEYPILDFGLGTGTDLELNKVADFTFGVNLKYEIPFRDNLLFTIIAGYNMGTGVGNSGNLTSTTNSSYYVKALTEWNIKGHHSANLSLDYTARTANLEGQNVSGTYKWVTDSTVLGAKLGYAYTF